MDALPRRPDRTGAKGRNLPELDPLQRPTRVGCTIPIRPSQTALVPERVEDHGFAIRPASGTVLYPRPGNTVDVRVLPRLRRDVLILAGDNGA